LFASGILGPNYEVIGQDPGFEPHYDLINDPNQAQIYEFIMGDVNGNVTTTLERADTLLKDNRLVPLGFTTSHSVYDTCRIAGQALNDSNFNWDGGQEGSGSDLVRYRVPLNGYLDTLTVSARVWYQTVRPGWLDEMFANTSPEIDRFQAWYQASDKSTVLVAEQEHTGTITGLPDVRPLEFSAFPNPTSDGNLLIGLPESLEALIVRVFDLQGRLISHELADPTSLFLVRLPAPGTYLVEVSNGRERAVKRVAYLN